MVLYAEYKLQLECEQVSVFYRDVTLFFVLRATIMKKNAFVELLQRPGTIFDFLCLLLAAYKRDENESAERFHISKQAFARKSLARINF